MSLFRQWLWKIDWDKYKPFYHKTSLVLYSLVLFGFVCTWFVIGEVTFSKYGLDEVSYDFFGLTLIGLASNFCLQMFLVSTVIYPTAIGYYSDFDGCAEVVEYGFLFLTSIFGVMCSHLLLFTPVYLGWVFPNSLVTDTNETIKGLSAVFTVLLPLVMPVLFNYLAMPVWWNWSNMAIDSAQVAK